MNAEALIAAWPELMRGIGQAARTLILTLDPAAAETVKWRAPVFVLGGSSICSLGCHARHVNLQIWNGALLEDPHGLVEGTGKAMRHVKLRRVEDVARPELASLLRQGVLQTISGGNRRPAAQTKDEMNG